MMKTRLGFVSNSSSSSFVCDACGATESGWDIGLREAEMYRCIHDHTFCNDCGHIDTNDINIKRSTLLIQMEAMILEGTKPNADDYVQRRADDAQEDIVTLAKMSDLELKGIDTGDAAEFKNWYDSVEEAVPSDSCPCCTFKILANSDLYAYLLTCNEQKKEDVREEIRSKFNSYIEFREYVSGIKK